MATEVCPPRPSDICWPTKYELLTTSRSVVINLGPISVYFGPTLCSLERHHDLSNLVSYDQPFEIGD
jgi:hypothetical protein